MIVTEGNIFEEAAEEERKEFDRVFGKPKKKPANKQPKETIVIKRYE